MSQRKMTPPRHEVIAEYWRDKYITRDGRITDHLVEDAVKVIDDVHEVACWACGFPVVTPAEERGEWDFERIWSYKKVSDRLERCHIVPEMHGGGVEPENMFLLCKRCHPESPDTTNRSAFFRWVYDQKITHDGGGHTFLVVMKDLNLELKRRGEPSLEEIVESLKGETLDQFLDSFRSLESKQFLKNNAGMHRFGVNYNSMIITFVDLIERQYLKVVLA